MQCEECGIRPAEVMMTTVIGGQTTTRHLCRECVKKYKAGDIQAVPDITCPSCGETFAEFQKTGMLGCAECYQAFRGELTPLITRVQGRTQHAGRRPPVSQAEQERLARMESLHAQMEAAVAVENFEEAARLRDALRAMTEPVPEEDRPSQEEQHG